jgi:hypothetical protein
VRNTSLAFVEAGVHGIYYRWRLFTLPGATSERHWFHGGRVQRFAV